jgi:hypothetical protein
MRSGPMVVRVQEPVSRAGGGTAARGTENFSDFGLRGLKIALPDLNT